MTIITTTTLTEQKAAADYQTFCQLVHRHVGLDLSAYKREQMERRLRVMADRVGAATLCDYWAKIADDPRALSLFLDRVTINVSEFYRNRDKFEILQQKILPALLKDRRELFVWSAGCSYGAEAYSLKILLTQLTPGVNHRILATDIDIRCLERARKGCFSADDLREVPDTVRRRYFTAAEDGFQIVPALRQGVTLQHGDLLRDAFPERVDLILCRNVVIYFSDDAKNRLYRRFFNALRPGGYLLVGNTERIFDAQEIGYKSPLPFFYQRPDNT